MKNLIEYINEKLKTNWSGSITELFKLFNRDCGDQIKTSVKDVLNKKNFIVYALDIDNDQQKVINEYEFLVKEVSQSDNTVSFKMDAAKEYSNVPAHIKDFMPSLLPKYWGVHQLWFNYTKESENNNNKMGILFLNSTRESGKGFAVVALSKENKEIFTNWVENLDTTEYEELEKAALKAWEETKKESEKEEKERKRNRKPKQPTYNAKSSLIKIPNDFYYDKELGSEALIKAAINEFNKYGYDGGLFTTKQIKDLFKDTHDENFAIIEFDGNSRGYEKADKAIESLFKKGSWIDYTPEYEQQGLDDDNSVLMKFNSTDGRKIYVLDSGDWGISWTCVQL